METQTIEKNLLTENQESQKQELINWISTINDVQVIENLTELKRRATFNFEEEFKKGLTVEEFRAAIKKRIKNYDWKK